MKIKISKSQWEQMGKKAGWMSPDFKWSPDDPKFGNDLSFMTEEDWAKREKNRKERESIKPPRETHFVKVTFDDGDTVRTSINGSRQEIEDYYMKQDFAKHDENGTHRGVKVEFLD